MRQTFRLVHERARALALEAVRTAPHGFQVEVKPPARSLAQNARFWAMLDDISHQVVWYKQKLSSEDWKLVFTAAWKKHEVVPGIDGGFVVLGLRTSTLTVSEMGELMELMSAFGAERAVIWSDPKEAAPASRR